MSWKVYMFENDRVIEVRVRARSESAATAKAEALCPDAAHLVTERIRRQS